MVRDLWIRAEVYEDLEEIQGNILSTSILANMKLLKKSEVVLSKEPLRVGNAKIDYLKDYHVITKHDNPKVIRMYTEMERK